MMGDAGLTRPEKSKPHASGPRGFAGPIFDHAHAHYVRLGDNARRIALAHARCASIPSPPETAARLTGRLVYDFDRERDRRDVRRPSQGVIAHRHGGRLARRRWLLVPTKGAATRSNAAHNATSGTLPNAQNRASCGTRDSESRLRSDCTQNAGLASDADSVTCKPERSTSLRRFRRLNSTMCRGM